MESLLKLLEGQDQSRTAMITLSATTTVADLIKQAHSLRSIERSAKDFTVANSNDVTRFIAELAAYDGWAGTVFLQPARAAGNPDLHPDIATVMRRKLQPGERTRWVLATSGTMGIPKLISHTLASLTATTKSDARVGTVHRWGLLYDPARFAGLQVVLQALLGRSVLVAPRIDALDEAVDFMLAHGVTALSATPSHWRKLLMTYSIERLPLRQITLGGEIADASILNALRKRFPHCRLTHIYASTEAGVGFSVRDGGPGFPVSFLEDGALEGVQLRVSGDGHLLIRKTRLEQRAVGTPEMSGTDEGFIDSGDVVEIRGNRVYFLGRASGLINVGGNKVSPEAVEAVLCSHPMVVAARVSGKRSSFLGSMVVAEVQVRDAVRADDVKKELNELCRSRLARYQCPTTIHVVAELGIGHSGKMDRKGTLYG